MSEDLIKRADAIRALSEAFAECEPCDKEEAIDIAVTTVKEIPSADRADGWIPVDKRLPTKEEQDDELGVLVTLGNGYSGLQFDYYYNGLWDDWNGYVVAWMSLPKPWKGADDE